MDCAPAPTAETPLNGLVLAGGWSTRMGTDKASMIHPDGMTLARRSLEMLQAAGCGRRFFSLRHDQNPPDGLKDAVFKIVRDPENDSSGPISGVLAAMESDPNADWLVISCDLPRLNVETLVTLASGRTKAPRFIAYRSESDGMPEPLCALYPGPLRDVLVKSKREGILGLRRILIRNGCHLLDFPTSGELTNANTPADWKNSFPGPPDSPSS